MYIQSEVPRVYLFSMQLVIQNIYIYLFLCSTCILTWFFRIWELPALSFPGTSKTIWTKFSHFLVWSCQPAIAYCLPANRCWPLSSDTRIMISKWRLYVHQPASYCLVVAMHCWSYQASTMDDGGRNKSFRMMMTLGWLGPHCNHSLLCSDPQIRSCIHTYT